MFHAREPVAMAMVTEVLSALLAQLVTLLEAQVPPCQLQYNNHTIDNRDL